MRLIDADRLKAEIVGWFVVTDDLFGMGKYYEREIVLQAIEESPAIDAVSVVRGEWVEAKSGVMSVWPPGQVMCSVCGQRMPSQWKKMPPYCYGCGAKMEDKPCE